MKKFAIKKFLCGSLKEIKAKVIEAKNVDVARIEGEKIFAPIRKNEFVGAQRIIYR